MSSRGATSELLVVAVSGGLCVAAWMLPAPKPSAVFGRLNYAEFLTAVAASVVFAIALVIGAMPRNSRKSAAFRIVAVLTAAVLSLGFWELAAFARPRWFVSENPWYLTTGTGIAADSDLPFVRPAKLEWTGRSHGDLATLNGESDPFARNVRFATDEWGFRNDSIPERAEILFLGDSFTEAGNTPINETFAAIVGEALSCSIYNLGRAGYCPPTERVILEKYGLRLQPKTVVWQIAESNDLDESVLYQAWLAAGKPPFPGIANDAASASPTRRLFGLLRRPLAWPLTGWFPTGNGETREVRFFELPEARHSPVQHPGWTILSESVRAGNDMLRHAGATLIVLHIPMKATVLAPFVRWNPELAPLEMERWMPANERTLAFALERLCRELKATFLDAGPSLRKTAATGELVYLPFDTHLSPAGHRIIAHLLIEAIGRQRTASSDGDRPKQ